MKIRLNNNQEEVPGDSITVDELLKHKNYTFRMLVIKINGTLVKKPDYDTALISEGDEVTVLHLISGG
jgi:sulfur carrier protein